LDAADGACATGAEQHFVVEDAVAPDGAEDFFAWDRHVDGFDMLVLWVYVTWSFRDADLAIYGLVGVLRP
jgi:hypothetical protein